MWVRKEGLTPTRAVNLPKPYLGHFGKAVVGTHAVMPRAISGAGQSVG